MPGGLQNDLREENATISGEGECICPKATGSHLVTANNRHRNTDFLSGVKENFYGVPGFNNNGVFQHDGVGYFYILIVFKML